MSSEIHLNDVGTRFLITVKDRDTIVNIANYSSLTLIFKKPSSTTIYRSGILHTDGTDGKIRYDTAAGDLNETGTYKLQGRVALPSGTFYTDIHNFQVHCNL